jgi:hypothetical protein
VEGFLLLWEVLKGKNVQEEIHLRIYSLSYRKSEENISDLTKKDIATQIHSNWRDLIQNGESGDSS